MSSAPVRLDRQEILNQAKAQGVDGTRALLDAAVHQLLQRVARTHSAMFMLKGGQALAARGITTRKTHDLDVRGDARSSREAAEALDQAAAFDLGDGLTFTTSGEPRVLRASETGGYVGLTVKFDVTISATFMAKLKIDVVVTREPTGHVTTVAKPPPFEAAGASPVGVAVFPIEDHIADKVCAVMASYGSGQSSRPRDLYDLCAIAAAARVNAAHLAEALALEQLRRKLVPASYLEPVDSWRSDWASLHRGFGNESSVPADFDSAVTSTREFVDPVMSGAVEAGTWDPSTRAWTQGPAPRSRRAHA